MKKNWRIILVVLLLIAVAAVGYFSMANPDAAPSQSVQQSESGIQQGKQFLNLQVSDLKGNPIEIKAQGQVMIINFWATWCPPCRNEMPELNAFVKEHPEVVFYGINIQESPDKVAAFMQQHQYNLPVYLDQDGEAAKTYQVKAIPTTLIIDKKGIIQYRKAGAVTKAEVEGILKGLR